jgi:hypothetical protein
MSKLTLPLLLLAGLMSCSSPKPGTGIYHLDPKTWPTQTVALDDIIQEIRVIPLATKPECQIGYVYDIEFAPDMIIMANSNGFSCFDSTGNFLHQLSTKGKGPGEYVSVGDIVVNEDRSELLMNDYQIGKLLYFNLAGDFLRSSDAAFEGNRIKLINRDLIALHDGRMGANSENFELALINWDGRVQKLCFPFLRAVDGDQCRGFAAGTTPRSVLYYKAFNTGIFEIYPDHIDTLLTLDFGSSAIDTLKYLTPGEFFKSYDEKEKVHGFDYLTNTPSHLAATIAMGGGTRGTWVLDHQSKKHRFLAADTLNSIGNFKGCPVYIPRQTNKSWFVSIIDGINWFESISKLSEAQKVTLRRDIPGFVEAEKVTMDGNPVLVYFRFLGL